MPWQITQMSDVRREFVTKVLPGRAIFPVCSPRPPSVPSVPWCRLALNLGPTRRCSGCARAIPIWIAPAISSFATWPKSGRRRPQARPGNLRCKLQPHPFRPAVLRLPSSEDPSAANNGLSPSDRHPTAPPRIVSCALNEFQTSSAPCEHPHGRLSRDPAGQRPLVPAGTGAHDAFGAGRETLRIGPALLRTSRRLGPDGAGALPSFAASDGRIRLELGRRRVRG